MSAPNADFVVTYRNLMMDGLSREVEKTRNVLAAVPDDKSSYRPDAHARTAWDLAWHIASSDVHFLDGIADLKFNMTPADDKPKNIAELLGWYDRNMARTSERVKAMTAEQLSTPIAFFGVFNLPAALYLQFQNNHTIHHRGELATYLRPMGSKVPQIYGGSFDAPLQPPAAGSSAA
ncbi:MAG: DinB family protein [Terriglobales bacterium]|jgi:uncharacterized damage-inducible protein DinB